VHVKLLRRVAAIPNTLLNCGPASTRAEGDEWNDSHFSTINTWRAGYGPLQIAVCVALIG